MNEASGYVFGLHSFIKMQFDGVMTLHYIYLKEGHTTHCSGKDRSVPKGQ